MPANEYRALYGAIAANGESNSGITVNATTAQKFSAVFACVRTYEMVMASLPIRVTGREDGKIVDKSDGPIYELLHYPNRYLNRFTFIGLMNAILQLKGNAVAVITFDKKGIPVELTPVDWDCVRMVLQEKEPVYVIDDPEAGVKGTYLGWEVIHFRINSRNGWTGLSPISAARESIGLGLAADRFGADFFRKGGNLKGVLETDGHLGDEEFRKFKEHWDAYYTGQAGDHTAPVLEYGMKYKPLGIPPGDAQFIETRVHQVQDIARFFGIPPSVIGENSKNAFTSAEQQDIQFVKYSLFPLCKSQEVELEHKLMNRFDQEKIDIKFNLDGLLRGDMITRARYEQTLVASGIITRNEAREIEGKEPLPGLDEPLNPAFLTGKQEMLNNDNSNDNGK